MREPSTAVIVLGMHRTGTSLVMGALEAMGVYSGNHLLPPGPDNEMGYWEDEAILDLNERLLGVLGKTWYSLALITEADWLRQQVVDLRNEAITLLQHKFASTEVWGFKDPRVIRLLPFWQDVLAELGANVKFVVTFRNPESVAASLALRNQFARGKSYLLWLAYYVPYLERLLCSSCLYVNYDEFMDKPHDVMDAIAAFAIGSTSAQKDVVRERTSIFLKDKFRETLRHARFDMTDLDTRAPSILSDAFGVLKRLSLGGSQEQELRTVQALQRRYADDALLLQDMDAVEATASRLQTLIDAEEPVRDKIEKMGLYQADLQIKMEQIDARHAEQVRRSELLTQKFDMLSTALATVDTRVEGVQEKIMLQMEGLSRQQSTELANIGARVEDIQEKVAIQVDELSRQQSTELANIGARVEDIQERVAIRMDELFRQQSTELVNIGARVEDVQEKVVVQMDELYDSVFGHSGHGTRKALPVELAMRQLIDAQAEIDAIYRSTSWRLTRPLRAFKLLMLKMLSAMRR